MYGYEVQNGYHLHRLYPAAKLAIFLRGGQVFLLKFFIVNQVFFLKLSRDLK